MYQSSAAFGELIQQDSRTFKARITIDGESTSGVIKGLVLNGGSNTEDDFSIGSAFSQYVEVTISGTDTRFEGHEFFLEMGAVGVEEYIPMGYFTAGKPETDEEQISFTAYDRMAKLDRPCFLNLSETTDTISVLKAIGTISGVPVITSGLSYITMTKPVGYTCREVLSFVAQMYGGFAICNRSGQIEVKTYQDSGYTVSTGRYWDSFIHNDYDFVLDKITCYTGKDESGNDISISVGSGTREVSFSNPFMTQAMLDKVWLSLENYTYMPGSLRFLGDPRIDPWDILTVEDRNGNSYKVPVMKLTMEYDGGLSTSVEAVGKSEAEQESGFQGPTAKMMDRYYAQLVVIDHALVNKIDADVVEANYVRSQTFEGLRADFESTKTRYLEFESATGNDLTLIHGNIETLEGDYAKFKTAVAGDFSAVNGQITNLSGDLSTYKTQIAGQFTAFEADITNLRAKDAELEKAVIGKASVGDLDAVRTRTGQLESDYAKLNTLVNGNLTSANIQSLNLTAANTTIENGMIKNAMIESLAFDKITGIDVNTTKLTVHSEDGRSTWTDNTIQISDANRVRVQMGKDASGDYTLAVWDAAGNLIFDALGATENTIQRKIIRDAVIADDAAIAGSKLDIESVVREVNGATTKLKSTTILLDDKNQTLDVAFKSMETTVVTNLTESKSYADSKASDALSSAQSYADGKASDALSNAQTYADSAAGNALSSAQGYADSKANSALSDAKGYADSAADSALSDAKSYADSTATTTLSSAQQYALNQANNVLASAKTYAETQASSALGTAKTYAETQANSALNNAKTYADGAVEGIEVGGRNLLQQYIYAGYRCSKIDDLTIKVGTEVGDTYFYLRSHCDLKAGETYTISCEASNVPDGCNWSFGIRTQGSKWQLYINRNGKCYATGVLDVDIKSNTDFLIDDMYNSPSTAPNIILKNFKLEKGNKATDWTPAPEDTESKITNLTEITTTHTTQITTVQGQISSLIAEDTTIKGNYDALVSRYNATVATVDSMQTTIGEHTTLLDSQSSQILAVQTKANTIESDLSGTKQTVSSIQTDLTNTKSRVTTVETGLDGLKSRVTATETAITKKADGTTVDSLTSRVATAESTLTGFEASLTATNKTVSDNYTALKSYTDSAKSSAISTAASDATAKANSALASAKSYSDAGIAGIEIGGRNLLLGTKNFSNKWICQGTTPVLEDDGFCYCTVFSEWSRYIKQSVSLEIGYYTISFLAKASNNVSLTIKDDSLNNYELKVVTVSGTEWKRYAVPIKIIKCEYIPHICLLTRQSNTEIYIKKIKLEHGTKPTDYTEAPEDFQSQIDTTNATVATHTEQISYHDTRITANENSIKLKVSTSDYEAYKTTINDEIVSAKSRLTTAESSITTMQGQIALKVEQTDIDTAVHGIDVGGRNLLLNTADLTRWNIESGVSVTKEDDGWYKITDSVHNSSRWGIYQDFYNYEQNTDYTVSVDLKNGNTTISISVGFGNFGDIAKASESTDGKRFFYTFNTGSHTETFIRIYIALVVTATNEYGYAKLPKLERGNKPTDWTPAPEDTESKITAVDAKFANYSTTTQMTAAITAAKDSITQSVSSTYATKASLETANGNITSLTSRMQTAESKLTKDGLTTIVGDYYTTSTVVDSKIDGIEIGGRNLFKKCKSGARTVASSDGKSISIVNLDLGDTYFYVESYEDYEVGKYYTLSCTVSGLDSDDYTWNFSILNNDSNGVLHAKNGRCSVTFKATPDCVKTGLLIDDGAKPYFQNSIVTFTKFKLERGNRPTDWTPAPEDVDASISAVNTIATQTADKFNWLVKSGTSSTDFTLTDRTATLVAESINLKGLVTFSGLDSTAQSKINTAQSTADSAVSAASTAQSTANSAQTAASNAQSTANTAKTNAATAQSTADSAKANAATAQSTANTALTNANSAKAWTDANGANMTSMLSMVKMWTGNAVSDTTRINGGWIETNTVTANKIAIGDFTNYASWKDKTADTCPFDTLGTGWSVDTSVYRTNTSCYKFTASSTGISTMGTIKIPVNVGESFYLEFYYKTDSGWTCETGNSKLRIGSASGDLIYGASILSSGSTSWTKVSGSFSVDASNATPYLLVTISMNPTTTGKRIWIDDIVIRKKTSGELIVDGSITASKIASKTITADKIDVSDLFAQDITATGTIRGVKLVSATGSIGDLTVNSNGLTYGALSFGSSGSKFSLTKSSLQYSDFKINSSGVSVGSSSAGIFEDWPFKVYYTFQFRDYSNTMRTPISSASSTGGRVATMTSQSGKIKVSGDWGATTGLSNMYVTVSSSDIRLKDNIRKSTVEALPVINRMKLYEFDWKQGRKHQKIGFVADYLEEVDSQLTIGGGYDEDGRMDVKSVDSFYMLGYAVKGIQELCDITSSTDRNLTVFKAETQSRIAALESQLQQAYTRIAALEKQLQAAG